jgi:hypothetical protein
MKACLCQPQTAGTALEQTCPAFFQPVKAVLTVDLGSCSRSAARLKLPNCATQLNRYQSFQSFVRDIE